VQLSGLVDAWCHGCICLVLVRHLSLGHLIH
jgi:hypothetical protein